jgi:hypothetical protein
LERVLLFERMERVVWVDRVVGLERVVRAQRIVGFEAGGVVVIIADGMDGADN